jgi:hypothetical protein
MTRRKSHRLLSAPLLLTALVLTGCYRYTPLIVTVREKATHAPLPGVTVVVRNTSLLNPAKPQRAEGVTDESGEVELEVAMYNDLLIRLAHPEHANHVWVGLHPYAADSTTSGRWLGPLLGADGERATLELQLR